MGEFAMRRFAVMAASAAMVTVLCAPAYAQQAEATAETAPAQSAGSDEAAEHHTIVITAQKRLENVQDVPISVAAISGESLEQSNIDSIQNLGNIVPNFTVVKGVASTALRLNIRGIGAYPNSATEPSVAPFLDGVYVPRAGSLLASFMDIESVEVLRGPQGTLFGRNASVGAMSLHSATPKSRFSARATAEAGNFGRYKLDGYVNAPITDNVAFRLAGQANWFDGYWKNDYDGKTYGEQNDYAVRGSVKADLGIFEIIVRADYSKISGDGIVNNDFDATSVSPTQLATLQARLGGQLPDTDLNDRHMNQFVTGDLDDRQYGIMSEASLDVGGGTIRMINSYRNWKSDQLDGDVVFLPLPILSRIGEFSSKSDNHELQYISPVNEWLGGRLDMVAGLYYYHEKYKLSEQLDLNSQFCNALAPAPFRPACNAYPDGNRRRRRYPSGRQTDDQEPGDLRTGQFQDRRSPHPGARRPLNQGQEVGRLFAGHQHVQSGDQCHPGKFAPRTGGLDPPRCGRRPLHLSHRPQL